LTPYKAWSPLYMSLDCSRRRSLRILKNSLE
jgi:hypothetical protein